MNKLALLGVGLPGLFFAASVVQGQAPVRPARTAASVTLSQASSGQPSVGGQADRRGDRRSSALVCELSAFFSVEPEDRLGQTASLDGRGLMSCQTQQGFTSETPVMIDLTAEIPRGLPTTGEITFSANSTAFVIPRDVSQAQDTYTLRSLARMPASLEAPSTLLFRGDKNDLAIELDLTSTTPGLESLNIKAMRLHFDESAPDLF